MNHRFIASSAMVCVGALVIASAALTPASVSGQAPAATARAAAAAPATTAAKAAPAAKAWSLSRTPDGQPDLQGFWATTNNPNVPLERNASLGAKESYTPEEYAALRGGGGAARGAAQAGGGPAPVAGGGPATAAGGAAAGAGAAAAVAPRGAAPAARGGARGGPVGRGGIAPPVTTNTADIHYDTAQFGLRGGTAATSLRTSMILGPEGRVPALSAEGQKRLAAYNADQAAAREHQWDGAENRPLAERCIVWNTEGPPMLAQGYNNNLQIVQSKDSVMILQEMIHDVRIIPLDGRPHVSPNIRLWFGDSRGHWEGDTLVVDTTNFNGRNPYRPVANGGVASENMHLIERFTRTGPDTLVYQFTVDDPATWSKPWTTEVTWAQSSGPLFEYACHEGNYGIANILKGRRAEEKAAK